MNNGIALGMILRSQKAGVHTNKKKEKDKKACRKKQVEEE